MEGNNRVLLDDVLGGVTSEMKSEHKASQCPASQKGQWNYTWIQAPVPIKFTYATCLVSRPSLVLLDLRAGSHSLTKIAMIRLPKVYVAGPANGSRKRYVRTILFYSFPLRLLLLLLFPLLLPNAFKFPELSPLFLLFSFLPLLRLLSSPHCLCCLFSAIIPTSTPKYGHNWEIRLQ